MLEIFLYILTFLMTFVGVRKFRKWILRKKIVDIPNERSSHKTPVPRGGGLIIVLVCLTFYTFYTVLIGGNFSLAYVIGAGFIAFVSWIDDLKSVSYGARLIVHSTSALLIIWAGGGWTNVYLPYFELVNLGYFGSIITFLWVVWLTNAYNFMDGIDGIAALEGVITGIGWFAVGFIYELPAVSFLGGIVAASCFGFLLYNWQPAKIFMGDVGSAFLGYTFAVMPLLTNDKNSPNNVYLPLIGVILVWVFAFDSIYTLISRVVKLEKFWVAHRQHIYQKLVISGLRHSTTTVIYAGLSAFTLIVLIFRLKTGAYFDSVLIVSLSISPLILFVISLRRNLSM